MTQEEIENHIAQLTAKSLVMRDFIAWFLATLSAASSKDHYAGIRFASESEDRRIDAVGASSIGQIEMVEMLRQEKDWIISAATKILGEK